MKEKQQDIRSTGSKERITLGFSMKQLLLRPTHSGFFKDVVERGGNLRSTPTLSCLRVQQRLVLSQIEKSSMIFNGNTTGQYAGVNALFKKTRRGRVGLLALYTDSAVAHLSVRHTVCLSKEKRTEQLLQRELVRPLKSEETKTKERPFGLSRKSKSGPIWVGELVVTKTKERYGK